MLKNIAMTLFNYFNNLQQQQFVSTICIITQNIVHNVMEQKY